QTRRQEALDGFRSGHYQILVATDIAARGIDVSTISHVINYDMPDTVDAYTHRIGRTGRAARSGDAFTLVTPADRPAVRAIEKMMGTRIAVRQLAHAGRKPEQRPAASSNQPTVGVQRSVRDGDPGEPSRRPRRTRRPRPRGATGAPIRRHGPASEGAEVRGDGRERAGRRPGSASRSRHPSSQPAAGPRRRSWKRRTASARS
ncbi:MAG: helicase-related protein, partial [Dehalococcoidia bacterium]